MRARMGVGAKRLPPPLDRNTLSLVWSHLKAKWGDMIPTPTLVDDSAKRFWENIIMAPTPISVFCPSLLHGLRAFVNCIERAVELRYNMPSNPSLVHLASI